MTDRLIAFLILCLMFSFPLGVAVVFTGEVILDFVFFWPLFMSAALDKRWALLLVLPRAPLAMGAGHTATCTRRQSADFHSCAVL